MKLVFIAQFCSPHSYFIIDELEFLECISHERYEFDNFGISCYIYYFLSTFFKFHFIAIYLLTFKKWFVRSFTFSIVTFMFAWCRYTYTIYEIVTKWSKWQCRSQACSQPIVRSFIDPSVGRTTYSIYLVYLVTLFYRSSKLKEKVTNPPWFQKSIFLLFLLLAFFTCTAHLWVYVPPRLS